MSERHLYTSVLFNGSVNSVNILLAKESEKGHENHKEPLQYFLTFVSGMLHVGIIPRTGDLNLQAFLCSRSTGSTVRFQKLKYKNTYSAEI